MSSTVILGSGIIGVSIALYLADHQPPSSIHLVDPAPELFSSASGFAGGFLARDWFSDAAASLGALSFEEHERLAKQHNGKEKWGYSMTTSLSYTAAPKSGNKKRGDDWLREGTSRADTAPTLEDDDMSGKTPGWLRRVAGDHVELISEDGSTAIVDPLKLSRFLLQRCLDLGVHLHHPAAALSASTDVRGELARVRIADLRTSTETDLPCTRLIVAAGAWSGGVFQNLFPHSKVALPIGALAGHSLVLRSPRWDPGAEELRCHAVYTTAEAFSPEVYARPGGHLYIAGLNSTSIPLPKLAGESEVQKESIQRLKQVAISLLGSEAGHDDLEVVQEGLCFRPVTPWGNPILSRIPDEHLGIGMATRGGADGGVFVCTGHGPWGINHSLGTGKVMAELAQGRALSADISSLGLRK